MIASRGHLGICCRRGKTKSITKIDKHVQAMARRLAGIKPAYARAFATSTVDNDVVAITLSTRPAWQIYTLNMYSDNLKHAHTKYANT
jgi:hypothetical protein